MYLMMLPGRKGTVFLAAPGLYIELSHEAWEPIRQKREEFKAEYGTAQGKRIARLFERVRAVGSLSIDDISQRFALGLLNYMEGAVAELRIRRKLYPSLIAPYLDEGAVPPSVSLQMCRWHVNAILDATPSVLVNAAAHAMSFHMLTLSDTVTSSEEALEAAIASLHRELEEAPNEARAALYRQKRLATYQTLLWLVRSNPSRAKTRCEAFRQMSNAVAAADHARFVQDFRHLATQSFFDEWLSRAFDQPIDKLIVDRGLWPLAYLFPAMTNALAQRPTQKVVALNELERGFHKAWQDIDRLWDQACDATRRLVAKGSHLGYPFTILGRIALARECGFQPPYDRRWVYEACSLNFLALENVVEREVMTGSEAVENVLVPSFMELVESDGRKQEMSTRNSRKTRRRERVAVPAESKGSGASNEESGHRDDQDAQESADGLSESAYSELVPELQQSSIPKLDDATRLQICEGAWPYFLNTLRDIKGRLATLSDGASAVQEAKLHRSRIKALGQQLAEGIADPDAAVELLTAVDLWVSDVHAQLSRQQARSSRRAAFEQALRSALAGSTYILEGHAGGGVINCPLLHEDWPCIHAAFHGHRVDGLTRRLFGVEVELQPDEAYVLYLTCSSRSGYLFDVSLHLWRRRGWSESDASVSSTLTALPESLTGSETLLPRAPSVGSGRGRGAGRGTGRGGRQPQPQPSGMTTAALRIADDQMDRDEWYDTHATALVLHVPLLVESSSKKKRQRKNKQTLSQHG